MKNFVSTVVGGLIGLAALYAVGRIAYQAGHDVAEAECHYKEVVEKTKAIETSKEKPEAVEEAPAPEKLPAKKPGLFGRILKKKESMIGNLINHPEAHRIEAFVDGEELKVSVKPKSA